MRAGLAMKVVILAGGVGTRLSEETATRPKPMVEIGGMPILWHIMKIYSAPGQFLAVNVGSDGWNYKVKDLAHAVATSVPGTKVSINTAAPPDGRSYKVDFALFRKLAPNH